MTLKLNGSSSGYTAIDAPAAAGSNTLVLPTNNGSANQILQTDGNGNLSWVDKPSSGLTMAETWSLENANMDHSGADDVTANWGKQNSHTSLIGNIGSSMTESSGVFTFPSTGYYLCILDFSGKCTSSSNSEYNGARQWVSSDSGSNWTKLASDYTNGPSNQNHFSVHSTILVDVTNASTFRWKCDVESQQNTTWFGTSNGTNKASGVTFIKIGDT